jgi:hypothetical protein
MAQSTAHKPDRDLREIRSDIKALIYRAKEAMGKSNQIIEKTERLIKQSTSIREEAPLYAISDG